MHAVIIMELAGIGTLDSLIITHKLNLSKADKGRKWRQIYRAILRTMREVAQVGMGVGVWVSALHAFLLVGGKLLRAVPVWAWWFVS